MSMFTIIRIKYQNQAAGAFSIESGSLAPLKIATKQCSSYSNKTFIYYNLEI